MLSSAVVNQRNDYRKILYSDYRGLHGCLSRDIRLALLCTSLIQLRVSESPPPRLGLQWLDVVGSDEDPFLALLRSKPRTPPCIRMIHTRSGHVAQIAKNHSEQTHLDRGLSAIHDDVNTDTPPTAPFPYQLAGLNPSKQHKWTLMSA